MESTFSFKSSGIRRKNNVFLLLETKATRTKCQQYVGDSLPKQGHFDGAASWPLVSDSCSEWEG